MANDRKEPQLGRTSFLARIRAHAFARVDIASLVFFRIAFGVIMIWAAGRILVFGLVEAWYLKAPFLFKYAGFDWVVPWPGTGMYIHWIALGVLAFFIAIGFFYRISVALFCLGYTYCFLLDQGRYVNHTYLICLMSFLLIFIPAHRACSVDAKRNLKLRSQTAPAWSLWLLRIQMAVVYFFAGIAKIVPDWFQGEALRFWMHRRAHFPVFDKFLHEEWAVYAGSYGSLLLDLLLPPLLLWRRTRVYAFFAAAIFHFLNNWIFPLDIFPYLAVASTTVFLDPGWPRRIAFVFAEKKKKAPKRPDEPLPSLAKQNLILALIAIYTAIQILVPLRNWLHPGGIEWTYMEHRFSWQMMLRINAISVKFHVTDPNTGRTTEIRPKEFIDLKQMKRMGWRPDMVWQFAQFLARTEPRFGEKPLEVRVSMYVSINGRKPELFIDPTVNLAAEPRPWTRPRWLLAVHTPLPPLEERLSNKRPRASSEGE